MSDIAALRRELKRARFAMNRYPPAGPESWHAREVARLEAELDAALRAEGHRPLPGLEE